MFSASFLSQPVRRRQARAAAVEGSAVVHSSKTVLKAFSRAGKPGMART
jgi:hypothetical protein